VDVVRAAGAEVQAVEVRRVAWPASRSGGVRLVKR